MFAFLSGQEMVWFRKKPKIVNDRYRGKIPDSHKKYGILKAINPIGYKQFGKTRRYFYLWKCDCGNEKEYPVKEVICENYKSCGCLSYLLNPRGGTTQRNPQMSSWRMLFKRYKSNAKFRKYKFEIDLDQFISICQLDCFYCGEKPKPQNKWNEPNVRKNGRKIKDSEIKDYEVFANGIDRIDSSVGYTIDNIRPCCKNCNRAKMDLTEESFFNLIQKIYERHIK